MADRRQPSRRSLRKHGYHPDVDGHTTNLAPQTKRARSGAGVGTGRWRAPRGGGMMDVTVSTEKSVSPAAIRMARSRARRRRYLRCVTIEVRDREIEAFIRAGDLPSERRNDPKAIAQAVHKLLDFVAKQERW